MKKQLLLFILIFSIVSITNSMQRNVEQITLREFDLATVVSVFLPQMIGNGVNRDKISDLYKFITNRDLVLDGKSLNDLDIEFSGCRLILEKQYPGSKLYFDKMKHDFWCNRYFCRQEEWEDNYNSCEMEFIAMNLFNLKKFELKQIKLYAEDFLNPVLYYGTKCVAEKVKIVNPNSTNENSVAQLLKKINSLETQLQIMQRNNSNH